MIGDDWIRVTRGPEGLMTCDLCVRGVFLVVPVRWGEPIIAGPWTAKVRGHDGKITVSIQAPIEIRISLVKGEKNEPVAAADAVVAGG